MRASTRASMRASTRGRARACRRTPTGTCTRATSRTSRWRDSEYTFTEGARTRATRRSSSARGRQPSRARGRRAQEEGGQVGFDVSFPSGRTRASFEILRIVKQTRILGSKTEILLNLLVIVSPALMTKMKSQRKPVEVLHRLHDELGSPCTDQQPRA